MSPYRKSDAGKTSTRTYGRLRRWGAALRETIADGACGSMPGTSDTLTICMMGASLTVMVTASSVAIILLNERLPVGAHGAIASILATLFLAGVSILVSLLFVGAIRLWLARRLAAGTVRPIGTGEPTAAYAESKTVLPTIATTQVTAPSASNKGATESVDVPRPDHIPQGLWDGMSVRDRMYVAHIAAQMAMLEKFLQNTIAYRFADFKAKGIPGDELHVLRNICREAGGRGLSFGDNALLRALVDRGLVTAYKATPLGEVVLSAAIAGDIEVTSCRDGRTVPSVDAQENKK